MTRPTISSIAPFLIVADVPATLSFYREMLGFEVTFRGPTPDDEFFGIVPRWRDDHAKALGEISAGKEITVEPLPSYRREPAHSWDAHLDVSDPDALAAEFGNVTSTLQPDIAVRDARPLIRCERAADHRPERNTASAYYEKARSEPCLADPSEYSLAAGSERSRE